MYFNDDWLRLTLIRFWKFRTLAQKLIRFSSFLIILCCVEFTLIPQLGTNISVFKPWDGTATVQISAASYNIAHTACY